jgi:predicted transcriptional regulator
MLQARDSRVLYAEIPSTLHRALSLLAASRETTLTALAEEAVRRFIKDEDPKLLPTSYRKSRGAA